MVVSEGDGAHAIDVERGVRPVVDAKIDVTGCVAGAPRPRPAEADGDHAGHSGQTVRHPGGEGNSAVACGCAGW